MFAGPQSNVRTRVFLGRHTTFVACFTVLCGWFGAPAQAATFWPSSPTPGTPAVWDDTSAVTLGVPFYTDTAGQVTGVRFYKASTNRGTHIGSLWSSGGTELASVTFSGETAAGWQQANFSSPVSIAANTTYVIAYFAPSGSYADDQYYAWTSLNSAPLHISGSTGVYAYGSGSTFPTESWNRSNYWVDVVFAPGSSGGPTLHSISGTVTGTGATLTLSGNTSGSTQTNSAGVFSFSGLANGSYVIVPGEGGYSFSPATALATINGGECNGNSFYRDGHSRSQGAQCLADMVAERLGECCRLPSLPQQQFVGTLRAAQRKPTCRDRIRG